MNEADELLILEMSLLDPATRSDANRLSMLLAENFKEFGASGRTYTKREIIDFLVSESNYTPPTLEDFIVEFRSYDVAFVTYRSVREGSACVRSSLWIRVSGTWQILFHQGTRAAPSST